MALKERTEEEILAQAPIKMRFGAADYDVNILRFTKAREWRENAIKAVQEIVAAHTAECATNDAFTHGLAFFFLEFPDKMVDLILAYAVDVPRAVIENDATDEQVAFAFGQVVSIAFPFTKELATISSVMGTAATYPRSAKSSN